VALLPIRIIDEMTSGHLRHTILESEFIEASFSFDDEEWNLPIIRGVPKW
jgi:hypothetical protein